MFFFLILTILGVIKKSTLINHKSYGVLHAVIQRYTYFYIKGYLYIPFYIKIGVTLSYSMKDPVTLVVYPCTFFFYTQNSKNQEKKHFFDLQPGHQGAWKGVTQAEIGVTLI